ncbi:MAG TPA: 5-methyltetrahydropteroyltriglutamate--homocysteine S-methyltransferase [Burkholderiales bacterium]|jgi:5-methyltetrahydropteroyltriglutamate--homocysteine methyltransferase
MELSKPPFRADHVGSLLRPAQLRLAHEKAIVGQHDPNELRELEDRCIGEAIALQESLGLHAITDGEFRRTSFHADFIEKLDGARASGSMHSSGGQFGPRAFQVTGKLRRSKPIEVAAFSFVKRHTSRVAKLTIPSPTMLLRGGRGAVSREAYPDLAEFHADVARAYREELRALADAGCSYVQIDDTNFAYLCDAKLKHVWEEWGADAGAMADLINAALDGRPAGLTVALHVCRGNSGGKWAAEGAYDPIAETLFNRLEVDAYFLEYDDARSGGFEPLRLLPRSKKVVLGLVSSKTAQLESKGELKRRLEQAARYVPLENLCLSPQCGFASTFRGNPLGEDAQRRKLERIVEVAAEVWGSAR